MAREAYWSLYGDLTKLKDNSLLDDPAGGAGGDDELFRLLLACSDWVDRYCNRHFYPKTETLTFDGNAAKVLPLPDLIAITTLKEDENEDLTFETTWAATDYWTEPQNAAPTQPWGMPYTSLRVRAKGTKTTFTAGEHRFEVAGRWGYREHQEDSGSNINEGAQFSATATTLTVTSGSDFAIGQTIMIESEQLLATNIAANNLTVVRGINGTTAAAHNDTTDIYTLRWPAAVERATLMQTARIWTRAPAFEPFYVDADLDTDIRMLLESYRKASV